MREILFRAKRKDNGEWVEGYYLHVSEGEGTYDCEEHFIKTEYKGRFGPCYEVIPETVGQYTGQKDKNGKKIFEGDVLSTRRNGIETKKLKGCFGFDSEGYPQRVPGYEGSTEYHYSRQIDCLATVRFSPRHGFYLDGASVFVDAICNEIVGNIHDNPELLRVK